MKKVLVIDDSETMREMIKSQFEQSGMEFSFAENGKNALDILEKNNNFDLIICDVYMDEMSGIEFVKAQDQDERLKNIPTVLMTSRFNPSFLKEINGVKVVKSWLVKPFKPEQLSLLIKNILKLE
ncbi:MAG: response regulator [Bdellovibrionota bacterium]|nr:response regulator [Bdellovibrionota bacterium]